jgi:hypothetical protein
MGIPDSPLNLYTIYPAISVEGLKFQFISTLPDTGSTVTSVSNGSSGLVQFVCEKTLFVSAGKTNRIK